MKSKDETFDRFQSWKSLVEKQSGKIGSYFHMFWDVMPKAVGGGCTGKLHIGRRVQLVIWLQILQEWIGIAGVTICEYEGSSAGKPHAKNCS